MATEQMLWGSYRPGNTVLHMLDPRVKTVLSLALSFVVFLFDRPLEMLVLIIFLIFLWAATGLSSGIFVKSMQPFIWIFAFTLIVRSLFEGGPALFAAGPLEVSRNGLLAGILMIYKILFLMTVAFLLNYTTSPMDMAEGTARIMAPLKRVGAPVQELSLMMTMTLRFIPMLEEEAGRIGTALQARGIKGWEKWWKKPYYVMFIFVPLLAGIFRRSDHLACAMEARGYRGKTPRSRLRQVSAGKHDLLACGFVAVLAVILWLI